MNWLTCCTDESTTDLVCTPFAAVSSENRHKRRHRAPRWRQFPGDANWALGAGRWRQLALGGGANWRWAMAPIGAGRWRQDVAVKSDEY